MFAKSLYSVHLFKQNIPNNEGNNNYTGIHKQPNNRSCSSARIAYTDDIF